MPWVLILQVKCYPSYPKKTKWPKTTTPSPQTKINTKNNTKTPKTTTAAAKPGLCRAPGRYTLPAHSVRRPLKSPCPVTVRSEKNRPLASRREGKILEKNSRKKMNKNNDFTMFFSRHLLCFSRKKGRKTMVSL